MNTRCGYIAIVGRPNVGKSTLLNKLLGRKVSITSRKPQTTRHQILGIKTQEGVQAIYVDTPGLHHHAPRAINRAMNRAARSAIFDVDVVVFMIDARGFTEADALVLRHLQTADRPVILALNKVDLLPDKKQLLPLLQTLSEKMPFVDIMPISVKQNTGVDDLENKVHALLPQGPYFFPEDQVTDKDQRFQIAEIVREKIMRVTGKEVPYGSAVMVESLRKEEGVWHIDVLIWVERAGQKIIIIGKKGEKLKEIGRQARLDMQSLLGGKVFLSVWIKIKGGWSDDKAALEQLGMGA